MITSSTLYSMYIESINLRINNLLEESLSYHTIHMSLMDKIESFKPYIDYCANYTIEEILDFTSVSKFKKIIFKVNSIFITKKTYTKKALELYINNYIEVNKIIVRNEQKVEQLKKQIITYSQYIKVLSYFNSNITDSMVEEGYIFNPGDAFGRLSIIKTISEKRRVNFGESNKAKSKLIDKGLTPYKKEDHIRSKELGEKYNGIPYLVFFPKEDYMVKWSRNEILRKWFPFIIQFRYVAAKSSTKIGLSDKMRKFINNNSRDKIDLLYDRIYTDERIKVS